MWPKFSARFTPGAGVLETYVKISLRDFYVLADLTPAQAPPTLATLVRPCALERRLQNKVFRSRVSNSNVERGTGR